MPRTRRATAARSAIVSDLPRRERKAMLASATNYGTTPIKPAATSAGGLKSSTANPRKPAAQSWQTTAWGYYDTIGEYRYSCDWVGNLLSRVKLQVTQKGEVVTTGPAFDLLDALFGGPDGQADMLRQIGRHWTVAGDCFIIGDGFSPDDAGSSSSNADEVDWLVAAATQITQSDAGLWKVGTYDVFSKSALVIRLWRPHPTDRTSSDSPSRAVLTILAEIDGLTKYVSAQIDSRLAGNGILLVPSEMSFGSAAPETPAIDPTEDDDPPPPARRDAQEFVRTLIEVASIAIADREDPASVVPIVLQGPGDELAAVRHVSLSTDLQTQALELRKEAVGRLALGMDMPPEILTGTSDMNHWSSWQIEEAAIKSHLEPLLAEICAALTDGYLRPSLEDNANAEDFAIEADTTALRLRPNRSVEALQLYDRGELSSEALLRENGFDPVNDAMSKKDLSDWLLKKIAGGSPSPNQVEAALEMLGVNLNVTPEKVTVTDQVKGQPNQAPGVGSVPDNAPPDPNGGDGADPGADQADPSEQNQPGTSTSAAVDDHVVFAGAMLVDRALERAGNVMRTKLGAPIRDQMGQIVPAARAYRHVALPEGSTNLDALLKDAWAGCDRWAADLGVDPVWLSNSLDSYTRNLLLTSRTHDIPHLRAHLVASA